MIERFRVICQAIMQGGTERPNLCKKQDRVQSHDILYKVSRDILYTSGRAVCAGV